MSVHSIFAIADARRCPEHRTARTVQDRPALECALGVDAVSHARHLDPSGQPSNMAARKGRDGLTPEDEPARPATEYFDPSTGQPIDGIPCSFCGELGALHTGIPLVGGANGAHICLRCAKLAVEILTSPTDGKRSRPARSVASLAHQHLRFLARCPRLDADVHGRPALLPIT
jgi:hypothetical protein